MPFFGFIPSAELLNTIQTAQKNKNSSEPLYPLRDKSALMINDEIIMNFQLAGGDTETETITANNNFVIEIMHDGNA